MEVYENVMRNIYKLKKTRCNAFYFGDIFLEDYVNKDKLAEIVLKAFFPLWKIPTHELIQEFISLGFKTIVVCVNERFLDKSFLVALSNQDFINDLPENVDVCGENGEFHTFTFDGPYSQNQ
jgi:diphthamide synthase (EF-2-diphthine--ammonia ligase)